jgi:hypothetical protein
MIAYGLDDHGRPHLVDGCVQQYDEKIERHDREQKCQSCPKHGIEGLGYRRQSHEREKRQPDKEPEVELIDPPAQELIENLMGERSGRLLQRHQQQ